MCAEPAFSFIPLRQIFLETCALQVDGWSSTEVKDRRIRRLWMTSCSSLSPYADLCYTVYRRCKLF